MQAVDELLPAEDDRIIAKALLSHLLLLNSKNLSLTFEGKSLKVNENILGVFVAMLEKVSKGDPITIISNTHEYSTKEAADVLHVSRPYLTKLLEKGAIPFRRVGTHRRIEAKDLFQYKNKLEKQKQEAFEELARLGQEIENV